MADGARTTDRRLRADSLGPWVVAGVIAWLGVAWIGWTLWQSSPPRAGFDLALLLEGARACRSRARAPYDPAMLAGTSPDAVELFYSYPPPVAQAMPLLAWVPNGVVLVLWAIGATLGFGWIAGAMARRGRLSGPPDGDQGDPRRAAGAAVRRRRAVRQPRRLVSAALRGAPPRGVPDGGRWTWLGAGAPLQSCRSPSCTPRPPPVARRRVWRERGGAVARVLGAAVVTGLAIVGLSLLVGGVQPWLDYVQVRPCRRGRRAGRSAQHRAGLAPRAGDGDGRRGPALASGRGRRCGPGRDVPRRARASGIRSFSLAIAITASLVTLPVTWYHYPVALMPVAAALAIRDRPSRGLGRRGHRRRRPRHRVRAADLAGGRDRHRHRVDGVPARRCPGPQ